MIIKNHTINVSHGLFGGMLESDEITASHEMTITFDATLDGGTDGWIDDLINAITSLSKQQTVFLTRQEVNKVRNEYRNIELAESLNEEGN